MVWLLMFRDSSILRPFLLAAALLFPLLSATAARADAGAWVWTEMRLPMYAGSDAFPKTQLRLWTDTRFSNDAGGLAQQFLRVGPLFHFAPWFFLGVHGTVYADRLPTGTFDQEVRVELEPNFHGRVGDFTLANRHRLEYRWRESAVRWRYRTQLRANYAPVGAEWIPFVWDEILVDLSGEGLNQNRAMGGLGWVFTEGMRLDAGYMLRSQDRGGKWQHDHIGVVYLLAEL